MTKCSSTLKPAFRHGVALLAAVACVGFGAAQAQPPGKKLNNAEIREAIFGHSWELSISEGPKYRLVVGKDGNGLREGTNVQGQRVRQIGHFKVENDKFCRFFENLENNRVRCFEIYQQGDKLFQFEDGTLVTIMIPVK